MPCLLFPDRCTLTMLELCVPRDCIHRDGCPAKRYLGHEPEGPRAILRWHRDREAEPEAPPRRSPTPRTPTRDIPKPRAMTLRTFTQQHEKDRRR